MAHIQTESEWQEEMSAKIMEFVRHELYMELRYLKLALSQLQLKTDPNLRAFATDGAYLYVAPEWLIGIFEKNAQYLDRAYGASLHFFPSVDRREPGQENVAFSV